MRANRPLRACRFWWESLAMQRRTLWCYTASFAQFGRLFRTLQAKRTLLINIHIEPAILMYYWCADLVVFVIPNKAKWKCVHCSKSGLGDVCQNDRDLCWVVLCSWQALWCYTASFAQFGRLFRTLQAKRTLLINIHIEPAILMYYWCADLVVFVIPNKAKWKEITWMGCLHPRKYLNQFETANNTQYM